MKAGRDMDALVAEKVMGDTDAYYLPLGEGELNVAARVPRYSTDIAAAWQVVEKFGYSPSIHVFRSHGGKWGCKISLSSDPNVDAEYFGFAETAPLAICLAALKKAGVEVPA